MRSLGAPAGGDAAPPELLCAERKVCTAGWLGGSLRWRRRMGIEPTSDSDCRSTVLKLANRTSLACTETTFAQVNGLVRCPLLSPGDRSVP